MAVTKGFKSDSISSALPALNPYQPNQSINLVGNASHFRNPVMLVSNALMEAIHPLITWISIQIMHGEVTHYFPNFRIQRNITSNNNISFSTCTIRPNQFSWERGYLANIKLDTGQRRSADYHEHPRDFGEVGWVGWAIWYNWSLRVRLVFIELLCNVV